MEYIVTKLFRMPVQIIGCASLWMRPSVHNGSVGRKF
jgi:hypothetical protein